ncbi:hypothetical protein WN943_008538 [Citrus x changshan-huyou]
MASSDDDVGVEQRDKYLSLLVLLTSKWRDESYKMEMKSRNRQADEEKKIVMVGFFYDRGEMPGGLLKGTKIDSSAFC